MSDEQGVSAIVRENVPNWVHYLKGRDPSVREDYTRDWHVSERAVILMICKLATMIAGNKLQNHIERFNVGNTHGRMCFSHRS